jgi:hypothetical protein
VHRGGHYLERRQVVACRNRHSELSGGGCQRLPKMTFYSPLRPILTD